MSNIFENRIHYLSQMVTMIWDAIDNIGCISISSSTLVCSIIVISMIYHIGCEDTERNSVFILGTEQNSQCCHVYYTLYHARVSVKFITEIKSSLTFILDAKNIRVGKWQL